MSRDPAAIPEELLTPHPARLAPDGFGYAAILAAHAEAHARGADGYLDPETGLFVMTVGYLWARGTCCETGCRHCPYLER